MTKGFVLAGAVLALGLCAAPAQAVEPMKVQETAENLRNLKTLLLSQADVTFTSELPGQAEADSMTAFGQTKTGERFIVAPFNFQASSATIQSEVAFYDDAALTVFSDLVVLYEDRFRTEAFGVSSDATGAPEPAVWAVLVCGFLGVGLGLRRARAPQA